MRAIFVPTMTAVFASTPGITLIVLYVKHFGTLAVKGSPICETKFYSTLSHCTLNQVSSAFVSLFFFFPQN